MIPPVFQMIPPVFQMIPLVFQMTDRPLTVPVTMQNRRAFLLATAALTLLPAVTARAAGPEQATAFIDQLSRDLAGVINGAGSVTDKQAGLTKIIDRAVDVADVARFCLGRFWRIASAEQQAAYLDLFHKVLVKNITGKVGEYQGVTITVGRAASRETDILVNSVVNRPGNEPNKVDWLVSLASGGPKIIDVIAEGTSLRLTQRSDYAAFLSRNNNSVQALIDAIRQQANAPG